MMRKKRLCCLVLYEKNRSMYRHKMTSQTEVHFHDAARYKHNFECVRYEDYLRLE